MFFYLYLRYIVTDLDGGGIAVLTICSILTLIMFLIYGEELWYLYKQNSISDSLKFNRRILLGIYPVNIQATYYITYASSMNVT